MGKKNLEQLFKEKLGDFHEVPDDKVWASIDASLNKKKQKRVVPIWWRLGGAAAVLAILLYVAAPFGDGDVDEQITVTETEAKETPIQNVGSEEAPKSEGVDKEDGLVDVQERTIQPSGSENTSETQEDAARHRIQNQSKVEEVQLAQTDAVTDPDDSSRTDVVPNVEKNTLREAAVANNDLGNESPREVPNASEAVAVQEQNNEPVTNQNAPFDTPVGEETVIAQTQQEKTNQEKTPKTVLETNEQEAVALQEEEENPDTRQSIFDAIAEQEEEVVANTGDSKWSMGPSVAPVYFNAAGEGSPVHSTFASNSKSGNLDLSYGLTVAYEIGKKLKIRSGVHRVNFGYDTNDVVFTSSLDGSVNLIDNIDYSQASRNIVLESKDKGALSADKAEFAASSSAILDGKMIQQLGYLEVPLEVNYSLIDKKFGVDLIGGVSSLFLVDNSVLLESEGLVTEVGEANNVNSMNFSTNVGIGFNYEFSPKVQLNLEPVFKYQLNTFSDTAGSFRPYSVGVYSGLSFRF